MGIVRLLLALFVVFYHCGGLFGFETMPGPVAVESFFIISGFYMAFILNEKYKTGSSIGYKLFLSNRVLRLYPVYAVVFVVTLVTALLFALVTSGNNWGALNYLLAYSNSFNGISFFSVLLTNIFIIGQDVLMFFGLNTSTGNFFFTTDFSQHTPQLHNFLLVPQAWSIAIELMFYVIAPFIVRKSIWFNIAVAGCSLAIKMWLNENGFTNDPWSYRFFPAEFWYFSLGILGYKLLLWLQNKIIPKFLPVLFFGVTLIVLCSYSYLHYYIRTYLFFAGFALAVPFIFQFSKSSKTDREIGELSYPVYISHVYFKQLTGSFFNGGSLSILCSSLSIVFSFIINAFLTKRVEIWRQKRLNRANNG